MINFVQYADLDDLIEVFNPLVRVRNGADVYFRVQTLKIPESTNVPMIKNVTFGVSVRVIEPMMNGALLLHSVFLPAYRYQDWSREEDKEKEGQGWLKADSKAHLVNEHIEGMGGIILPGVPWLDFNKIMFAGWRSEPKL